MSPIAVGFSQRKLNQKLAGFSRKHWAKARRFGLIRVRQLKLTAIKSSGKLLDKPSKNVATFQRKRATLQK